MIIFAAISIHAFQPERRPLRGVVASAALVSVLWCFIPSFAQDTTTQGMQTLGSFNWKKDASTGNELAASRSDSSFNYFDIGDLSYDSQSLVEQDLRRLSAAAGLTIDHTPAKNSSVSIVHDTKVFARLKYDKPAFKSLGFSDYEIETLEKQVTSESPKCLTMTVTDGNNGIVTTVILLSERFNSCLVSGMLSSFGIAASDISAETLIDVCVLYEDVGAVYGIAKALLGKILNSATFA
ncbi:hypothetical protein UB31_02215 [Bradyrhizobium sp. LTSP849]|uniref:hypothetical protein n=1 Tax=Bradyrhizobium sp. LTSP849 TaxID=1615890 RepID=UPI0005D25D76|nr:hypothetical protein [Bradyrhizobium sp. LTSP849]KJC55302.1 hypothetical protein UB31_02215 [Bradyrhizobium sp. LTSP849]